MDQIQNEVVDDVAVKLVDEVSDVMVGLMGDLIQYMIWAKLWVERVDEILAKIHDSENRVK